jgi:hypothetical protein
MALNRYLYPQKGTNIVQEATLATRVSLDAVGAVTGIVVGQGITVAKDGVVAGQYNVTFDNNSTVSNVVGVHANYVCAYDKTKKIAFHVASVSTTGCVLQAYQVDNGNAGDVDVAGSLFIQFTCTLSSVPA